MKIALIGKSASGKDTVKNLLIQKGLKPEVSYTTRLPRVGEVDEVSYHFMDNELFHEIDMIEKVCFNGWWYGTGKNEFDQSQLFIFTPSGLALLPPECRNQIIAVYLKVDRDTQYRRLLKRGDDLTELDRRIAADEVDFAEDKFVKYRDYNLAYDTSRLLPEQIANNIYEKYLKIENHIHQDFNLPI